MKKLSTLIIVLCLAVVLSLSFFACKPTDDGSQPTEIPSGALDSGNLIGSGNGTSGDIDLPSGNESGSGDEDNISSGDSDNTEKRKNVIKLEELSDSFFAVPSSESQWLSIENQDISYELGSEENELLFAEILRGDKKYSDYLGWFAMYPEYILRFNYEQIKCVNEVLAKGEFTQELRDKYYGVYTSDAIPYQYLASPTVDGMSYQIYFNEDWTIKYADQSMLYKDIEGYSDSEIKQLDKNYIPHYDKVGNLDGYFLHSSVLIIETIMEDDCKCHANVRVFYESEVKTERFWNGETKDWDVISYMSECRVDFDDNRVYGANHGVRFNEIMILTQLEGIYDLEKTWEYFREQAMTPSFNLHPETAENKIVILE